MVKKIAIGFLIVVSFVLLNIFSRFLYAQSWFGDTSFSKELDPFDIITLGVTTFVTIWFGIYISKKLTEQRYQKEYIISDIKLIEEEVTFIGRSSAQSHSLDLQSSLLSLNKLQNYIQRFSKTLEIFEVKNIEIKSLNNIYSRLYHKITDIGGSDIVLNEVIKNEINGICSELVLESRKIICSINKH